MSGTAIRNKIGRRGKSSPVSEYECNLLRRYVSYNPDTGILFWKERPSEFNVWVRVKVGNKIGSLEGPGYLNF